MATATKGGEGIHFGILAGGSSDPRPSNDSVVFRKRGSTKPAWARVLVGLSAALGLAGLMWALFIRFQILPPLEATDTDATAALLAEETEFAADEAKFIAVEGAINSAGTAAATAEANAVAAQALAATALTDVAVEQPLVAAAAALAANQAALPAFPSLPVTLTGSTSLWAFNGTTSSFVDIVNPLPFVLIKVGKIVTAQFGMAFSTNITPYAVPTPTPPFNTLVTHAGPIVSGAAGTQPSDQAPTGASVSWMPAAAQTFDVGLTRNFETTNPLFYVATLTVQPDGNLTIQPPADPNAPVVIHLQSFMASWVAAS